MGRKLQILVIYMEPKLKNGASLKNKEQKSGKYVCKTTYFK